MYIGSTNFFITLPDASKGMTPSWITSEKYYNCDFYYQISQLKKRKKLFKKAS